jgi:hypothetical protein
MVKLCGEPGVPVTWVFPKNSQMVGDRGLRGALSTRLLSGNALEASQSAMVPDIRPGGVKLIPVVVNETSALPGTQAAVP